MQVYVIEFRFLYPLQKKVQGYKRIISLSYTLSSTWLLYVYKKNYTKIYWGITCGPSWKSVASLIKMPFPWYSVNKMYYWVNMYIYWVSIVTNINLFFFQPRYCWIAWSHTSLPRTATTVRPSISMSWPQTVWPSSSTRGGDSRFTVSSHTTTRYKESPGMDTSMSCTLMAASPHGPLYILLFLWDV